MQIVPSYVRKFSVFSFSSHMTCRLLNSMERKRLRRGQVEVATGSPQFEVHTWLVRDRQLLTEQLRVILIFYFLFFAKVAISRDCTDFPLWGRGLEKLN